MEELEIQKIYRQLRKLLKKHAREVEHIDFLKNCIFLRITPKFLRIRNPFIFKNFHQEIYKFENRIIKKLIRQKYKDINHLREESEALKEKLREYESRQNVKYINEKLERFAEIEKDQLEKKHRKKLNFWVKGKSREKLIGNKLNQEINIPYLNLSSLKVNTHLDRTLRLGPKFILEDKINLKDTIASVETAIKYLEPAPKRKIRQVAQSEVERRIGNLARDGFDRKCLDELRRNKDVTCLETDKTGKIVILNKGDYIEKMETTINELNATKLKKDPNTRIENAVKKIIKEGTWPENKNPTIKNFAPNTPRIFAKYKDHKDPPTLRPIVSKCESPTYPLEKFMNTILKSIIPDSNRTINSTEEFIKEIREVQIDEKDIMVSFDIVNLYPSIEIQEIISIINEAIQATNYNNDIKNTLESTLNLILNNSVFQFNSEFYKQNKGVPMGSPISGTIADWKVRLLEESIIKNQSEIKFWIRYVDDIFAIIKEENPTDLLNKINQYDQNIKFTLEIEKEKVINFLDVKIIRTRNKFLDTTVYRKPTANNVIIHNRCKTPTAYKQAAIRSYINRAINVCSNEKLLAAEINKIKEICRSAGYKNKIVDSIYKNRIKKLNHVQDAQKEKPKFTTKIPYIKGASEKIKKAAAKLNINIPIRPNPNIFQRIRSEKEPLDYKETAGVYKINLKYLDEDRTGNYIGVTKRRISDRIKEHKNDIKTGKITTALTIENAKNNIEIDFNNYKKIASFRGITHNFIREKLEILTADGAINKAEGACVERNWTEIITEREKGVKKAARNEINLNS